MMSEQLSPLVRLFRRYRTHGTARQTIQITGQIVKSVRQTVDNQIYRLDSHTRATRLSNCKTETPDS